MATRNLHKEVTDRILKALREGTVPWRKPWKDHGFGIMPRNAATGRAYSGINVLLLLVTAQERGYEAPLWLTYQQASEAGGHVRKGEKGTQIVFVSTFEREDDKTGEAKRVAFLKAFTVFNVAQCEGLPEKIEPRQPQPHGDARNPLADEFISSTGAVVHHGESRAYYRPATDSIMLPRFEVFESASAYYATAFHELGHWTGSEKRLNRTFGKRFGDAAYSAEELVAELTSAFLCAEFEIETQGADAAYIATWIKFLSSHETAIVAAASAASKAIEHLRGLALAEDQEAA